MNSASLTLFYQHTVCCVRYIIVTQYSYLYDEAKGKKVPDKMKILDVMCDMIVIT